MPSPQIISASPEAGLSFTLLISQMLLPLLLTWRYSIIIGLLIKYIYYIMHDKLPTIAKRNAYTLLVFAYSYKIIIALVLPILQISAEIALW